MVGPTRGRGSLREWQERARGLLGSPRARLWPPSPPPCHEQVAVGEDLELVALGADVAPRCFLLVENEDLLCLRVRTVHVKIPEFWVLVKKEQPQGALFLPVTLAGPHL